MESTADTGFRHLGPASEVTEGYVVPFYVAALKRRVSVAKVDGELFAFDDLCTFEACPLSAGTLSGTTLLCQCHGCRYDITTGAVLRGPATAWLPIHTVRERDGAIEVIVSPQV